MKKKKLISLVVCWGILFIMHVFTGALSALIGDAPDYWNRGVSIWSGGQFSLLNMGDSFRGYIFPLYLGACNHFLFGRIGYAIVNSLLISILFTYIVPYFHGKDEDSFIKPLILFAFFSLSSWGLEVYPLSDLLAIMLCMGALIVGEKAMTCRHGGLRVVLLICFGAGIYAAYNVRTIYMFSGIYLVLRWLIYIIKNNQKILDNVIHCISVWLGFLCASLPQLYLNIKMLGQFTIKVPTSGLMLKQLYWGIKYQRYDTYIGGVQQADPQMYFIDPVGSALLEKYSLTSFSTWQDYFMLVLKHPFEILGIYVRHLINILLPCWPATYVKDLDNNKILYGLISYTFIFLVIYAGVSDCIDWTHIKKYICITIPMIFILPGAIEVRFFAGLYIIILGILCYNTDYKRLKIQFNSNKIKVILLFMLGGCLILSSWSMMLISETAYNIFLY